MLLLLALLVVALFFGLGFVADVLWWGILIGLVLAVAHVVSRGVGRRL